MSWMVSHNECLFESLSNFYHITITKGLFVSVFRYFFGLVFRRSKSWMISKARSWWKCASSFSLLSQLFAFVVIQFLDLLKANKNDKKLKTNTGSSRSSHMGPHNRDRRFSSTSWYERIQPKGHLFSLGRGGISWEVLWVCPAVSSPPQT
jgi:hypothetical protein